MVSSQHTYRGWLIRGISPLIIVLLVLAISVGIVLYRNQQKTHTNVDTSSWQSYTNASWGLSFKYPRPEKDFEIILTENGDTITLGALADWGITFTRIPHTTIDPYVKDLFDLNLDPKIAKDLGVVKMNGRDVRQIISHYDQGDSYNYIFQHGSDVIDIYAMPSNKYVLEILATLEFAAEASP